MATQSVKIPVELQLSNVKSQIEELKKTLGNVKEGTSSYKELNTVLQRLERQFTSLQTESKKAFSSEGQITHFQNGLERLGNLAEVFQERLQEANLEDLKIDVTNLNQANKKVQDLEEQINLLRKNKISDVFNGTSIENAIRQFNIRVDKETTFDGLVDNFRVASDRIQTEINALRGRIQLLNNQRSNFVNFQTGARGNLQNLATQNFTLSKDALRNTTSLILNHFNLDTIAGFEHINSAGATAEEYISNITLAISGALRTHNSRLQGEIDEAELNRTRIQNALAYMDNEGLTGTRRVNAAQSGEISRLSGIRASEGSANRIRRILESRFGTLDTDIQNNQNALRIINENDIRTYAETLRQQIEENRVLNRRAFEEQVRAFLHENNVDVNREQVRMLTSEDDTSYIERIIQLLRNRGIELNQEWKQIITDYNARQSELQQLSSATNLINRTQVNRQNKAKTIENKDLSEARTKQQEELNKALLEGEKIRNSLSYSQFSENIQRIKKDAEEGKISLNGLNEAQKRLNNIQDAIKQWFGFYEVINLTKRAISDAINHIRELDKVMTEIAVVTDMTQDELWDQISTYSAMAQKYGATTQGVYEVSQLYYQQGLQTAEVMQLTEETLKMAKIAGLDYADATDYMTVAIRGFKLEMSDAQDIVDVYSNIAAVTASDTEELAVAMSKTASSAEAVGSSFENTTAMIALMVETTREAPENIGSAMKSIISRYGEMTTNPAAIMDSEGEAMSLNKVDKALQSVGITLQDVNGQFRDFDEVILELSSKWDTIDKNTQRYIATVMAGNRQQSRFLALVGNYDRLSELYEEAANSQDAATLQTLKTMDSIETKINQLKTTFQEFYTNTGVEDLIKGIIDFTTQVIERIDGIPKVFDKIPLAALTMIGTLITTGKSGATLLMRGIFQIFDSMLPEVKVEGVKIGKYLKEGIEAGSKGVGDNIIKELNISSKKAKIGTSLAAVGSIISSLSLSLIPLETQAERITSGLIQGIGGFASAIGQVATGNYLGAIITAVSTLTSVIATMDETAEEKLERLTKAAEEANNDYLLKKNDFKNLDTEIKKLKELEKARYDSDEAYQNWIDYQNEIANKYPELIDYIDGEGNAILELSNSYTALADARLQATEAAIKANKANIDLTQNNYQEAQKNEEELIESVTFYTKTNLGLGEYYDEDKQKSIITSVGKNGREYESFNFETLEYEKINSDFFTTLDTFFQTEDFSIENLLNLVSSRTDNLESDLADYENIILESLLNNIILSLKNNGIEIPEYLYDENQEILIEEALNFIEGTFNSINQQTKLAQKQVKIAQQSYLSSMIQWSNTEQEMLENTSFTEMLKEMPSINAIIEDTLKNRAKDFESLDVYAESAQYDTDYTEIINYLIDWYSSLSSSVKEQFITAYGNMGSYSFEDFKQVINFNDLNKETQDIIEKQFNEQYRQSQENFYNALNTQKNNLGISQKLGYYNFNDKIGSEYFDDILDMYYTYFDMFEEGNKNLAISGMQNLSELWNAIGDLEGSLQIQISDYLISDEVDLTSISGLYEAAAHLRELEVDESIITLLTNLSSSLVPNLNTEWQASLNNITSNLENLTDAFEKASSGMNLTDAQALASKLGTTLADSDFVFKQGQYYYNNIEAIKEAYLKNNEETKKALEENTKEQIDILTKVDTDFTLEEQETYSILQNTYKEVFKNLTEEERQGAKTWQQYAIAQIKESQIDFYEAEENYLKYLGNSTALAIGDLTSFLNNFKDSEGNSTIDENALKEAIATGDTSKLTGETLKVYYDYEEDLTKLITSSTDNILNSILESFSSQQVQTVDITNLSDYNNKLYEALKTSELEFEKIGEKEIVKINPSDITESEYSNILKATNYTAEQYNEAMVSFIEATSKNYQTVFEDITSNPREVELSTVEEWANLLDQKINTLIGWLFEENANGTYSIIGDLDSFYKVSAELKPAVNNIENAQRLIDDSLIAYTDEILGYISSGISGDLPNVEFSKLGEYIASLTDGQVSLSFERTAEGVKLTQSSLLQIYSTLQANNSLAAQIVLDELTESAMDADENLNNIYKVMERNAEINEELSTAGISDAREKALRAELALAENIRDTLMEAGDAFNFMDQDLPTGMTNPLSAWEGMGDAFKVLDGEDFKADRIGFQDFYNMITMMGDEVLAAAGIFTNDSQTAADLIEAGANALTNIDGETFVDLSKLGTNFNLGAEGMKEGLTDGIHTLAENQIEMLDAAIGVLETVVAMEGIGEVIGEDNEFTLGDLLMFGSDGSTIFTPEYKNWRKNLQTTLKENSEVKAIFDSIFIDGLRLSTWIGMSADELAGKSEEAQTQFLQALEALYSLSERGDFDPNNLQSIFDIFTQVGFNGYVELKDEDGDITGYWYNGKEYSSPAEANAAISATLAGGILEEDFTARTNEAGEIAGYTTTVTLGENTIELFVDPEGNTTYTTPNGFSGSTPDEALKAEYDNFLSKMPEAKREQWTFEGWKTKLGWKTEIIPELTIDQQAVLGATAEERAKIQQILESGIVSSNEDHNLLMKFGVDLAPETELTTEQIAELKSAFGIEDKTINLTVNATNVDTEIYNLLNGTTADIPTTITLTVENGENVQTALSAIKDTLIELESRGYNIELAYNITSTSEAEGTYDVTINDNGTVETLTNLADALTHLNTQAAALKDSANAIETTGPDNVKALKEQMNNLPDKSTEVGNTAKAMDRLDSKTISAKIIVSVSAPDGSNTVARTRSIQMTTEAKGNVALSKGTLMGELGPELYATNGHYYVAGQNGAEFVDLPDDAIVFNHLQTQRLLSSGSSGRGNPVTNEKKAVAFAGGNVSGPAMASAESALSELKAIRAMWQALLDQDAKSLGKKAGSGGGGGGGGGSTEETAAYIHDLERWYNLLRQIEKLEEQITYEQAKRENMRDGYDYSKSLQKELNLLKEQRKVYEDLSRLQKDYYDKRRQDLLSTDYSKIFTYDEDGLMQYVDGKNRGLDILATLNATDVNGKAKMNAKQQLAYLKSVGFNTSVLNTNVDGTKAEDDEQRVQNFWDGVDSWMAELDDLYDSYNEAATNMEEATQAINEILQEYIDNQLAVEEKLMQAIQDREQAEIDRIQDEKDALEEAAQSYIDGLNEALSKERDMYQKNETDAETAKLQRQLAILQRSGGSTSEIKSLQDQIDSRLKDAYFQEQQDQIDAIQEASDNQLEKLQTQIDLMTETLEYQKEHGLLWQEVYEMMNNWTPEQLLQFVEQYTKSYQEDSALENEEKSKETLKENEIWVANRTNKEQEQNWNNYYNSANYDKNLKEANKDKAFSAYQTAYESGGKEAAEAAANKVFEDAKNSNEQQKESASKTEKEKKEPAKAEPPISMTGKLKGGNVHMRAKADANSKIIKKIPKGTTVTLTGMSKSKKDGYYWFKASAAGKTGYMAYTSRWGNFSGNINELPKFENGGLVDFTGPAWVDGSKTKPEAFLSAEDTAMLKSKIFSNSDGSLKSLVAALEEITNNTSRYSNNTTTSEQIVIHNAQVNIQPGTISNDYDARRAGEMALEEMVKIARKTTNRVVSR